MHAMHPRTDNRAPEHACKLNSHDTPGANDAPPAAVACQTSEKPCCMGLVQENGYTPRDDMHHPRGVLGTT